MRTFHAEFLMAFIPRLCLMGFTFYQPLYLQRVIKYIAQEDSSKLTSLILVAQSILISFGLAVSSRVCKELNCFTKSFGQASRSIYNHINSRLVTIVRGALVPLVISKTLALPHSKADDSASITLVSSDIEATTGNIPGLHEQWAQSIEIGLGLYMLSTVVTGAVWAVLRIVIGKQPALTWIFTATKKIKHW